MAKSFAYTYIMFGDRMNEEKHLLPTHIQALPDDRQ